MSLLDSVSLPQLQLVALAGLPRQTDQRLACVALQTVNELYKVSNQGEALALLADVGTYVRSMETPAYPSR